MNTVYLNGAFLPAAEAKVSALDRGFIFGDGVYEVIPVYGGKLFRLGDHLQRLNNSLDAIRLDNPLSETQWSEVLQELVDKNGDGDQSVYLQVTRGVAARDHAFPADSTPTIFAMSNPLSPPPRELLENGIKVITLDDIRWQYCHIKAITLLPNILMRQQAVEAGAQEAILINNDGVVTEGAASNVFIVKDGLLLTPPVEVSLLPGITRVLILELAAQHGIPYAEATFGLAELQSADEIWVSSSTKEILPVTELDGKPVGNGKPGQHWHRMLELYQQYKATLGSNPGAE
jgi:D-alanine transaminase